jgi:hypothetical protein
MESKARMKKTKPNGPNPFDFLGLKYSIDGKKVEVFEAQNRKWAAYAKLPDYTLEKNCI